VRRPRLRLKDSGALLRQIDAHVHNLRSFFQDNAKGYRKNGPSLPHFPQFDAAPLRKAGAPAVAFCRRFPTVMSSSETVPLLGARNTHLDKVAGCCCVDGIQTKSDDTVLQGGHANDHHD
jgi:hypothetical protein